MSYTWLDFSYFLKSFVFLKSPWWLVWTLFCSGQHNFLKWITKKMRKESHKKISCGPSKNFKYISWSINICLNISWALSNPSRSLCIPLRGHFQLLRSKIGKWMRKDNFLFSFDLIKKEIVKKSSFNHNC